MDAHGHHAAVCSKGGHPIRRHNRVARWLARWLEDGRSDSTVALEQKIAQADGRMDVVVGLGDSQVWIDVAIVAATSECP